MDPVMDLDYLRTELTTRAEQMPAATSTTARLAAVRRRVRVRRQRWVAGVVAVTAVGFGAVAVLPEVLDRDAGQAFQPVAPTQTPRGETPAREAFPPVHWPSRIDGDTLSAGRFGEPSTRSQTWTMTVSTLDVRAYVYCRTDDPKATSALNVRINGQPLVRTGCSTSATVGSGSSFSSAKRGLLGGFGIRPGEPFTVEARLRHRFAGPGGHGPFAPARLGIAFYARDGQVRRLGPSASLPVVSGTPGHESHLVGTYAVPVRLGRVLHTNDLVTESTPPGSMLTYGWAVPGFKGTSRLRIDGRPMIRSSAGGISSTPISGQHRLVLRARGGIADGTLFLAVYEPID